MDLDDIDRARRGPMVVRSGGKVGIVPAATDLPWREAGAAVLDVHFFAARVWPEDILLRAGQVDAAQERWRIHNDLPDAEGVRHLIYMLERYYQGIAYDLQARLGISLDEMFRERRWRALAGFLNQLPSDSHLNKMLANDEEALERALRAREKAGAPQQRETRGPSMAEWSQTNAMLADLIDAVNRNTAVTQAAAGGKPGSVRPYPRPKTATDRVMARMRNAEHESMVAILLPNKAK